MAIFTLVSRVQRAVEFKQKATEGQIPYYWGFGGKTAWSNENNPPIPGIRDSIDFDTDMYILKRSDSPILVRPRTSAEEAAGDTNNCITYRGTYWKIVADNKAQEEEAHWVYLETRLEYGEISLNATYRKLGIYSGLNNGTTTYPTLLEPSQVVDRGTLEVLEYRKPVYRSTDQREIINVILEF